MTKQKQTYVGVVGYADSEFNFTQLLNATHSVPTKEQATKLAIALRDRLARMKKHQQHQLEWSVVSQVLA